MAYNSTVRLKHEGPGDPSNWHEAPTGHEWRLKGYVLTRDGNEIVVFVKQTDEGLVTIRGGGGTIDVYRRHQSGQKRRSRVG